MKSTDSGPSTNVPLKCPHPTCAAGVYVFKYSMAKHWELEHRSSTMPENITVDDKTTPIAMTADEKRNLGAVWQHIQRNKPKN